MGDPNKLHHNITQALLSNAVLSVANSAGTIIWVNDNFCQHCGYSREELIGKNHSILQSGTHTREFYQSLWDTINQGLVWQGEILNKKQNGNLFWEEVTIVPLLDENNKPEQFLALHADVTSKKELIESLRNRAQRQGLLAILGRSAVTGHNLQALLDQSISAITGSLNMTMGMVLQYISPNTLLLRSGCGIRDGEIGKTRFDTTSNDLAHLVRASDDPVLIENFKTDKRFRSNDFFDNQKINKGILLTLGDQKQPWGILAFFTDQAMILQSEEVFYIHALNSLLTERIFLYNLEEKLANERELSRKYLDMANVMFVAINDREEIILANYKTASVLGYEQGELIGHNWLDKFVPQSNLEALRPYFRKIINEQTSLENPESNLTFPVITRLGDTRLVKWHNTIIRDSNNKFVCVLSAGEDITDQIRAEKEKEFMQQELHQARKLEAIGHLAGGIAHDFNNILSSILGYNGLALEKPAVKNDPKLTEYLGEVEKAGHRAREIIAQLANFGKTSKNTLQPTLLPTLLNSTLKMLRSSIPASIIFDLHITMNTPSVLMDGEQFNQLMMRLLIHARNTMQDEGTLRIDLTSHNEVDNYCTSCSKQIRGNFVQLSISMSSDCPDENTLKSLFNDTQHQAGLSDLVQAHRLVHASAGHLLITPNADGGTRISAMFPVTNISEPEQPPIKPVGHSDSRIMVVDDENSVAGYLGELLDQCQYKSVVFTDASEALRSFTATPENYDLILTDQTMPLLSGLALSQRILTIRPDIPIVLMTGFSDKVDADIAARNNIRGFLQKPLETHKLLETIFRLLEESNS